MGAGLAVDAHRLPGGEVLGRALIGGGAPGGHFVDDGQAIGPDEGERQLHVCAAHDEAAAGPVRNGARGHFVAGEEVVHVVGILRHAFDIDGFAGIGLQLAGGGEMLGIGARKPLTAADNADGDAVRHHRRGRGIVGGRDIGRRLVVRRRRGSRSGGGRGAGRGGGRGAGRGGLRGGSRVRSRGGRRWRYGNGHGPLGRAVVGDGAGPVGTVGVADAHHADIQGLPAQY